MIRSCEPAVPKENVFDYTDAMLEAAIDQAVASERERCAKIAENLYLNDIGKMGSRASIQQVIAAAIRNGTK